MHTTLKRQRRTDAGSITQSSWHHLYACGRYFMGLLWRNDTIFAFDTAYFSVDNNACAHDWCRYIIPDNRAISSTREHRCASCVEARYCRLRRVWHCGIVLQPNKLRYYRRFYQFGYRNGSCKLKHYYRYACKLRAIPKTAARSRCCWTGVCAACNLSYCNEGRCAQLSYPARGAYHGAYQRHNRCNLCDVSAQTDEHVWQHHNSWFWYAFWCVCCRYKHR